MFFEDEKDILKDGADIQISDDGTVIWDDVLDNSDDELISLDDNSVVQEDKIGLSPSNDEVSDDELLSIISNDTKVSNTIEEPLAFENTEETQSFDSDDDFDLDKQLENINLSDGTDTLDNDFQMPNKKVKSKGSMNIILIALVFGIILAGGAYYLVQLFNNQEVSGDDLQRNQTVEDTMNNTTQEDIAQRNGGGNEDAPIEQDGAIPVVNEDETDTIKPDEKEPEEKKEVINVIPTGRPNPFLPIQKYLKVDIKEVKNKVNIQTETIVRYDQANIIKPPETYGVEDTATNKLLTISVSGIMYDSQKPSAIITYENNDYFVQKGDKLDDYRIVDIGKNFVTVAYGKNLYKANIGEEFKITDIYGNAKYLTNRYDGGRQYRAVVNDNSTKVTTPVTDSDIEIKTK